MRNTLRTLGRDTADLQHTLGCFFALIAASAPQDQNQTNNQRQKKVGQDVQDTKEDEKAHCSVELSDCSPYLKSI